MEIFFSILAIASLIFCSVIVIDKTIFDKKIRYIESGMTGRQIERKIGKKLEVLKIEESTYYARVSSFLKIFRYRLVFLNGKLLSKQRE